MVFEGNGFSFTPHTHTHTHTQQTNTNMLLIYIYINKHTHMFITDMSIYNNYKNVHTKNNDKHTFISHKKTHSVKK